jgi:hypothetical protein
MNTAATVPLAATVVPDAFAGMVGTLAKPIYALYVKNGKVPVRTMYRVWLLPA